MNKVCLCGKKMILVIADRDKPYCSGVSEMVWKCWGCGLKLPSYYGKDAFIYRIEKEEWERANK